MNLSLPKWIYLNLHDHFNSSTTWENTFLDNPDTYDYEWFRLPFFFLKNINHPHFGSGGEKFSLNFKKYYTEKFISCFYH